MTHSEFASVCIKADMYSVLKVRRRGNNELVTHFIDFSHYQKHTQ